MHVTLVNYEYPPHCGGGGQFTADLETALTSRNVGVDRIVDNRTSETSSFSQLLNFPLRVWRRRHEFSGTDIIHGHFSIPSSVSLPVISQRLSKPCIVNVMGADLYDPTRYRRLRLLLNAVNSRIFQNVDAIVVPSIDMLERLPEFARKKAQRIPYFIDNTTYTPGPIDTTPPLELLSVCRLVERKNLKTALDTVAELAQHRDIRYTIAGDGPQRKALEAHARTLGIENRVRFTGYVPDEELPSLYHDHDLFFLPSKHEAFGIVFLEALASGLPVVTSDTGGQTDIVTPSVGATASPNSPDELATAIDDVASNLERHATAAPDRVEESFTSDAVCDQYQQLYQEVSQ